MHDDIVFKTKSLYALVIIMSNRKDWRPIGSMGMNKQAHNRTRDIADLLHTYSYIGCINASSFSVLPWFYWLGKIFTAIDQKLEGLEIITVQHDVGYLR